MVYRKRLKIICQVLASNETKYDSDRGSFLTAIEHHHMVSLVSHQQQTCIQRAHIPRRKMSKILAAKIDARFGVRRSSVALYEQGAAPAPTLLVSQSVNRIPSQLPTKKGHFFAPKARSSELTMVTATVLSRVCCSSSASFGHRSRELMLRSSRSIRFLSSNGRSPLAPMPRILPKEAEQGRASATAQETSAGTGPAPGVYARTRDRTPVSWASLFLVGVAAASAVAYYKIERERRLERAMGKVVSSESEGWTPRPGYLAPRKFVPTKWGWFPREDGFGARESHTFLEDGQNPQEGCPVLLLFYALCCCC